MAAGPSSTGHPRLAEFRLIRQLAQRFGRTGRRVLCGIGDDAALIRPSKGQDLLVTTDLLTEDIHFRASAATMADLGYKAAVANLSDIAAMGGVPDYLLVTMAIPIGFRPSMIMNFYRGLMAACRPYDVRLIGGDTSASADGLFLSITMTGHVTTGRALTRSGARSGDWIFVTGTLGDSLAGLRLLEDSRPPVRLSRPFRTFLVGRHQRPSARIETGRALSRRGLASAAIDISDGLSGDLAHICEQSAVGAEIDLRHLPISPACKAFAATYRLDAARLAIEGGEDYELLFTVPPTARAKIDRLVRHADCRWTCIGIIRPPSFGLRMKDSQGKLHRLLPTSYQHFKKGFSPASGLSCSR
jgi:thiamine-monophosphate kinase